MRQHWWLDPEHTYLNHGTVGATPRVVLAAQQALQQQIEAHPARFLFRELLSSPAPAPAPVPAAAEVDVPAPPRPRLRAAADAVGAFVGARGDDLAFVDNASAGINAVLRSLVLQPGDELLLHDLAYGAVARAAQYVARRQGAQVVTFRWPFPADSADPGRWVDALTAAITPRTRLAIVDHIVSETSLVLPVAEIARACRARGVPLLVDGAHAPGAIALDIAAIGADWYVANLHKWAFAPRGCGVLWAAPARQHDLHPGVISWGLDQGLAAEFDWTGTRDPSAWLTAPAGLAFIEQTLGTVRMRDHNHALVCDAARHLAERAGCGWHTPGAMLGCMATVPLAPRLADALGATPAGATRLKDWLFHAHRIEAQILALRGALWVRLSAQVYNDAADIDQLADALDAFAA